MSTRNTRKDVEDVMTRERAADRLNLLEHYVSSIAMWMDRENVTDQERLSYIKGHPVTRAAARAADRSAPVVHRTYEDFGPNNIDNPREYRGPRTGA
jgi:hypothetical protein